MRLGVLDVGSNTVSSLVMDAHCGADPTPTSSSTATLLRGAAGTSRTFRSLSRLTGAAPSAAGFKVARALREGLIVRKLDTETDGDLVGSSR
ncbi:MAG: hypothetical protein ACOH2Q_16500 [Rhodococcus sp. (in: high G+C Gram-positive bacteria)]